MNVESIKKHKAEVLEDISLVKSPFTQKILGSKISATLLAIAHPILAKNSMRRVISQLTGNMVVSSSENRPFGISAMMHVKNEGEWIYKSIKSISCIADEIIAVDNGSDDNTLSEMKRAAADIGDKVKVFHVPGLWLEAWQKSLAETSYKWVIEWNGDFIAKEEGEHPIHELRDFISQLDEKRYYSLRLPLLNFDGDFDHHLKDMALCAEEQMFLYSPLTKFVAEDGYPYMRKPLYYTTIRYPHLVGYHVRMVKSKYIIFKRRFRSEWRRLGDYDKYPTVESYALEKAKEIWGTETEQEGADYFEKEFFADLVPYDTEKFGALPPTLQEEKERCRFKVEMKDGKFLRRLSKEQE